MIGTCKRGFGLMEVLFAMVVLSITVTGLLALQNHLSRNVYSGHRFISRLSFIKSYFVEADKERWYEESKEQVRKIDDPDLTLNYSIKKSPGKALKGFEHVIVEMVKASWPAMGGTKSEQFLKVRFLPRLKGQQSAQEK